jgi:hypothetical protein
MRFPLMYSMAGRSRGFKILGLTVMTVAMSACGGGGGGGSSSPEPVAAAAYTSPASPQTGAAPLSAKAVYASTHQTAHRASGIGTYLIDDHVVKVPETYQVGDTIEFSDTVVKISSVISPGVYAVTEANVFDVFSELEVSGSMSVSPTLAPAVASESGMRRAASAGERRSAAGLLSIPDLFDQVQLAQDTLADLRARGCIPGLSAVTVQGDPGKHEGGQASFTGRRVSLSECVLYEDDTGSVKMTQDINVGMMATSFSISRESKSMSLKFDGAYFLNGKIDVNASQQKLYRSRLISVSPNWDKALTESGVAKTLNLVLKAEVFVDLKTVVNAAVKGTAAYQVPGDFAIGIDAHFDNASGEWVSRAHTLSGGKHVEANAGFTDAGIALKEFSGRFSSGIEVGYTLQTQASSPYFADGGEGAIANALNAAKSGLSAEMSLYSSSRIGAGLTLDLNVGSSVPVAACRVDVSAEMGYAFIHFFQVRAGTALQSFSVFDTRNTLFTNPANVIFTWDLFSRQPATFVKSKWCGSTSNLIGLTGNSKVTRIFVTDQATGQVLGDSAYVLSSLLANEARPGMSRASARSGSGAAPAAAVSEVQPLEKLRVRVRTDGADQARYVISADVSGMGFGAADTGWAYAWRSANDDITLAQSNSPTTSFKVSCNGGCNSRLPIRLTVSSPDGKTFTLPFYMDYDAVPQAAGQVRYTPDGLLLDASASSDTEGVLPAYAWLSPSGLKRVTAKPVLLVLKNEDFYQDVVSRGAVKLFVKDSAGQYASVGLTPQAVSTLLSPEALAAHQPVISAVTMGSFTQGQATVVSIDGQDLTPGLRLDASFGSCTALSRSSYTTTFTCTSQTAGAGLLTLRLDDGLALATRNVAVAVAAAGAGTVEAADFASGLFDVYTYPRGMDAPGYGVDAHTSTGLYNGIHAITHKGWLLDATQGNWLALSNLNQDMLMLSADGHWLSEGRDGTLQPMGGGQFVYVTNVLSRTLSFSASSPATLNLATVAGLDATGVVSLPPGARVFVQGPSIRRGDEYRLFTGGNSGVQIESSLAAFRAANNISDGGFWCFNELCWRFDAGTTGGVLRLYAASHMPNTLPTPLDVAATWAVQTVRGVQVMVLNIPGSQAAQAGLGNGEAYFFALGPAGGVQMGQFSPAGSVDASGNGLINYSFNRVALDAILAYLKLPTSPAP